MYVKEKRIISEEEKDYIRHDVIIVAKAISYMYSQGLNKMTIGSCALNEYKKENIHKRCCCISLVS